MTQPIQTDALADLRIQIDSLDQQLLSLLNQRAKVAEKVGEIKRAEGSPFFRPDRVAQVIAKIENSNQGPCSMHMWRPFGEKSCRPVWHWKHHSVLRF